MRGAAVKALSLWQPWASLVVAGAKRIETRSWWTDYRGPLLIHAAGKATRAQIELRHEEPFRSALERAGVRRWQDLPLGAVIGVVELVDVRQIHGPGAVVVEPRAKWIEPPPLPELAFGDYQAGRFAWLLRNPRALPEPVPRRARQRLFEVAPQEVGFA
jgi:hypothetical protein